MGRNGAGKTTLLRAAAGLRRAGARDGSRRRGGVRAAAAEPRRLPGPRAGRRRAARRGRARGARRGRPRVARPTPTRATSPAASASGWRWRSCWPGARRATGCRGWSASTSRRAAWTAPARTSSRRGSASSPARGAGGASSPPTTSSSPPRSPTACVLLGDGELIADGPADEILSGGWYFATEVARILGAGRGDHARAGRRAARCAAARRAAGRRRAR